MEHFRLKQSTKDGEQPKKIRMSNLNAADQDYLIGIDTGGTYTDAVIWNKSKGVVAKAKSLTTREDQAIGIGNACRSVLNSSGISPADVSMVSMSTTLATNALVEGKGDSVLLVLCGFDRDLLAHGGLGLAMGRDPLLICNGGHDAMGAEHTLDSDALRTDLLAWRGRVSAVAVCASFSVRNPSHELRIADLVKEVLNVPVSLSHNLTPRLGGASRALTTYLNARLVSIVNGLIVRSQHYFEGQGFTCPLMIVRGDGSLVTAEFAKRRPIETILSGPAASVVGARHLTAIDNAFVSDIGGTTTDIAVLEKGLPRIDLHGARVGPYQTMVEAIAIRTFGLGGDSEVRITHRNLDTKIELGPRRVVPLALLADQYPDVLLPILRKQASTEHYTPLHGRFALLAHRPGSQDCILSASERILVDKLRDGPRALETLILRSVHLTHLSGLVQRGLVHVSGFTPSDAAHSLGLQDTWNREASLLGADILASQKSGAGLRNASSGTELSTFVLETTKRATAEALFETGLHEDGLDGTELVRSPLFQRAMSKRSGTTSLRPSLDRPVIGLGASAPLYYVDLEERTNSPCIVPEHADVANALGAVVGQVSVKVSLTVLKIGEAHFRITSGDGAIDVLDESEAIARAEFEAAEMARVSAQEAGAQDPSVEVEREVNVATVNGERIFLDATIIARAVGRPMLVKHEPRSSRLLVEEVSKLAAPDQADIIDSCSAPTGFEVLPVSSDGTDQRQEELTLDP